MGRKPCCEKMGLKKGPWSVEEDHILTNYIKLHGHSNWRALPKQAGLLRCGKSCRLRWTNYLRPDIKRGNFSNQEEQTIIELHQQLGNRWSTIAAKLPGRTDNEIKNVWHTHLKKKLKQREAACAQQPASVSDQKSTGQLVKDWTSPGNEILACAQPSSSDVSSSITAGGDSIAVNSSSAEVGSPEIFPDMDEDFWSEVLSADNSGAAAEVGKALRAGFDEPEPEFPYISWDDQFFAMEPVLDDRSTAFDGMDFWFDMLKNAEGLSEMA